MLLTLHFREIALTIRPLGGEREVLSVQLTTTTSFLDIAPELVKGRN